MSPRTKEQNALLKAERREHLLMSAVRVFVRKGYSATKISDIAKAAGLSHGLVYHYFESKEAIFVELVHMAVDASGAAVKELTVMKGSPEEKMYAMTDMLLKAMEEADLTQNFFFIMLQAMTFEGIPEEAKIYALKSFANFDMTVDMVRDLPGMSDVSDEELLPLVMTYWSAIQGLAMMKIQLGDNYAAPSVNVLMRLFKREM